MRYGDKGTALTTESLNELSASEMALRIADGEATSESVVQACLDRIAARDDDVHAWIHLDPDRALAEAQARDAEEPRGPLHGVPVGVKDIIDTADMPTQMGSPIYEGHRPPADASCVALVRAAGGIVLGKTVTCEFAGQAPGATTNPHDASRTPGGSSSGSAAAVADRMVPLAFGTQTGGSVLRPSSYCGIVGFKPSFGTFNPGGVMAAAVSLDTLGLHARTLDDVALLTSVLTNRAPFQPEPPDRPPRIGLCRTDMWDDAEPATRAAVEDAASRLEAAGARVQDVTLADEFSGLVAARDLFNAVERARLMAWHWASHRSLLSERLQATIQTGLDTKQADYVAAHRLAESCRAKMGAVFYGVDVLLAPSADGEAPVGLDRTGNPRFQGLWTSLHVPTITLPTHTGPAGMPVGIQLVAPHRDDDRLLNVAAWVWETLGPA